MKKYISNLGMQYIPKNKAEAAAQEVAKQMSRRVINPEQIHEFKKEFQDKIKKVNQDHPRCKDIVVDIYVYDKRGGDIRYNISGVTSVDLYWGIE